MPFYVYGQDRTDAGPAMADLTEAHWAYMDRFADRLILRGPTLSEDGTEHTGSVHVVDLPDQASAERFATEEPFQWAGLFQRVTVARPWSSGIASPAGTSPWSRGSGHRTPRNLTLGYTTT
jgi:hypothetical protein